MPSHKRAAETNSCRDMVRPSDGAGIARNQAAAWGAAHYYIRKRVGPNTVP